MPMPGAGPARTPSGVIPHDAAATKPPPQTMRRLVPADRLTGLGGNEHGLALAEVASRRTSFGSNDIVETPPTGWRDVLRDTIKDPMIWFLAATSVLFALVGDFREALIMVGALVPLVGMDGFLHRRTQASTQGLSSRLAGARDGDARRHTGADPRPSRSCRATSRS